MRNSSTGTIVLIVYVDDNLIFWSDSISIADLKWYLGHKFYTKDLGALRYFLWIEVACSSRGFCLSQRKYVLDLLSKTRLLSAHLVDNPMDFTVELDGEQSELFIDISWYQHFVGKLIYLMVTWLDIT